MVKAFVSNNAFSIGAILFTIAGSYFMLQDHEDKIAQLEKKFEEVEQNKVSKSEMALKEQFAAAELQEIRTDISHTSARLDKKIKLINELDDELKEISEENVDQEARLRQAEGELDGLWGFTNKFLEELN